jgi:tripartite-type tricarboxylate transporter receptor subunit TctC
VGVLSNLKAGVESGKIRPLASNGLSRSPLLPELPPLADIVPGFDMVSVIGIYGRSGTPDPIVAKIAAGAGAIMKEPEMNSALAPLGMEPVGEGPEPFAKMIAQEVSTIAKVVESVGLKPK